METPQVRASDVLEFPQNVLLVSLISEQGCVFVV